MRSQPMRFQAILLLLLFAMLLFENLYTSQLHSPVLKCRNELWTSRTHVVQFHRKKIEQQKNGDVQMWTVIMHVLLQGNWKFVKLLSTCRLCALQILTNETHRNKNAQSIRTDNSKVLYCDAKPGGLKTVCRHQLKRNPFVPTQVEINFSLAGV